MSDDVILPEPEPDPPPDPDELFGKPDEVTEPDAPEISEIDFIEERRRELRER